jgi:hypothetical protein
MFPRSPGVGADVSSLDWVETRMRPRASNAPSQTRDRGGGSSVPYSHASSGSLGAYPAADRRCARRCRMACSISSTLMTAQRARSRCCVSSSVAAWLPVSIGARKGLTPRFSSLLIQVLLHCWQTMSARVTVRCCSRETAPVGSARMMTSVAGLSVLRIHLEMTSSSLPGLRSPQKMHVTIGWAVTTD